MADNAGRQASRARAVHSPRPTGMQVTRRPSEEMGMPVVSVTPYVAGWFRKPGGNLYVNRGIGTIGVPIRIGAPPEITVLRLRRAGPRLL